jgi:hypothetical protein
MDGKSVKKEKKTFLLMHPPPSNLLVLLTFFFFFVSFPVYVKIIKFLLVPICCTRLLRYCLPWMQFFASPSANAPANMQVNQLIAFFLCFQGRYCTQLLAKTTVLVVFNF